MVINLTAAGDDDGRRLDRVLRKAMRDLPLSAIHRLFRKGYVRIDGKRAAANDRIETGQTIIVHLDHDQSIMAEFKKNGFPNDLKDMQYRGLKTINFPPLQILFEGAGLLFLNKPPGLVVHGMAGKYNISLEDQVRSYLASVIPSSLSFRPGPLHRLDKPSSGIIVFSTNLQGARLFSELLRKHAVKKSYLALVEGEIKKSEFWTDELLRDRDQRKTLVLQDGEYRSKSAITKVTPLASNSVFTLVHAEIETGRTHQIRAQAASHGHPLCMDKKYGGHDFPDATSLSKEKTEQFSRNFLLHAWYMELPSCLGELPCMIKAPLPEYFKNKAIELFSLKEDFFSRLYRNDREGQS